MTFWKDIAGREACYHAVNKRTKIYARSDL
jgi:hypothetical protein